MFKFLFLVTAFLVSSIISNCQLNYKFSAVSGSYVPLTIADTALLMPEALNYEEQDDGITGPMPIGFLFNYNGVGYTSMSASTNGFASFQLLKPIINTRDYDYATPDLSEGPYGETNVRPALAPLWDDNDLFAYNDIVYKTTGIAPNRIFTIQWNNVYWDKTADNASMTFQLRLYETTNLIEFHYKQLPGTAGPYTSSSIGITATKMGPGNFISLENTSASPTISSITDVYSLKIKPATGQIYRFTPIYSTAKSGNWSDPATWDGNKVPPKGVSVIIRHKVKGNISATCNSLSTENPGDLLIEPGVTITLTK